MKLILTTEVIKNSIDSFYSLYCNERPIKDNTGGMKSPHLFATYCMLKNLNPKNIIESGVFKGQGSWMISKSCPDANIYCIEPNHDIIQFKLEKAKYFEEDFSLLNFDEIDKENTLIFFDDHQNAMERVKLCDKLGFKHLIFEDNYPTTQGDCLSLKKILSKKDYFIKDSWCKFNIEDYNYLTDKIKVYYEFPPIFKGKNTRWGDLWNDENYNTANCVFDENKASDYPVFWQEKEDYTWICYVELN